MSNPRNSKGKCSTVLVDIKNRIDEAEVKELISYSVFPEPEVLEQVIEDYRTDDQLKLYGLMMEDILIGMIGYEFKADRVLEIKHISVRPECRGEGYGRGLILEVIPLESPIEIVAETDDDAADFYRNIGFTIESLGELYPNVERYKCIYIV